MVTTFYHLISGSLGQSVDIIKFVINLAYKFCLQFIFWHWYRDCKEEEEEEEDEEINGKY
jgi:hypothetical protein